MASISAPLPTFNQSADGTYSIDGLEVFRAGDYGDKGRFSPDDLAGIAARYDAQRCEAPVTVDHKQSGPAFGWVRALTARGASLLATVESVPAEMFEAIKSGAYKKRSIELYRSAKFLDTPGQYLKAVTFLGAAIPEVKGMRDLAFADASEWSAFDDSQTSIKEIKPMNTPETEPGATPAPVVDFAAITAENEALKAQVAQFAEREAAAEKARRIDEFKRGVESLSAAGKVTPAEVPMLVAFAETLANIQGPPVVTFGEGDAAKAFNDPVFALAHLLAQRPVVVPIGGKPETQFKAGQAPDASDPEALSKFRDARAKEIMTERSATAQPVSYSDALKLADNEIGYGRE